MTNAAPSFPQSNYVVEISFTGSEAGDVPIATDPDQTPPPFVTDMDELKYTCDAPGISIDSSAHTFQVVDEAAFRRAMGSGNAFTLTATDPFGAAGTTQIKFRLAAGSTVVGTVRGIPQLIETITPLAGGAPAVVTHVLGGVTLTVSHETKEGSGSALVFKPLVRTSVVRASSTAPIAGHPGWEVVYPVAPGAAQPGVITTGAPVTTPDGQNQTITVSSFETVDIIDNSQFGGGALIARIVFSSLLKKRCFWRRVSFGRF